MCAYVICSIEEDLMYCRECGQELGEGEYCRNCGAKRFAAPEEESPKKKGLSKRARIVLIANASVCLVLAAVVVYAFATARHWTKVDVPEQPETFHTETYETGNYIVHMDDEPVCYVGQSWQECTNAYIAEYNRECTKPLGYGSGSESKAGFQFRNQARFDNPDEVDGFLRPVANFTFYNPSEELCSDYKAMIEDMQSKGNQWSYVASLGDWGHLYSEPEVKSEQVSNNDYKPAIIHEAVCYLGFIGECE